MTGLFWWIAQNAATAALLVPVVWLACRLRRSRPAEQHLLWLLLLVKLITPPVVHWPWPADGLTGWKVTDDIASAVATSTPMQDAATLVPEPLSDRDALALDELMTALSGPAMPASEFAEAAAPVVPLSTLHETEPETETDLWRTAVQIAALLWLFGAATVCVRIGSSIVKQRRVLRTSHEPSPDLRRIVDEVGQRLRIARVRAVVSTDAASPFVSCLGRPVLIWPETLTDPQSLSNCEGVIAHELAHIRRRDHRLVWLELVAAPVWWWNPVFWYLQRRLDETRELACDALALEATASDRRTFAELLLAFSASGRPALPFAPLRTGIAPRHSFRRRLTMLFDRSVSGRVSSAGLLLAGLLAIAVLPGWAWSQEEPPATAEPAAEDPAAAASPTTDATRPRPAATDEAAAPATAPGPGAAPLPTAAPSPTTPNSDVPSTTAPTPTYDASSIPGVAPSSATQLAGGRGTIQDIGEGKKKISLGDGRSLILALTPDGSIVRIEVIEDGRSRKYVLDGEKSVLDDATTTPLGRPLSRAAGPLGRQLSRETIPAPQKVDEAATNRRSQSATLDIASDPYAARNDTQLQLLENELELAMLEVEEKQIALEQQREANKRQQALFETGATAERPRDLRLFEIDVKKSQLRAEHARIQLEAVKAGRAASPLQRR